MVRPLDASVSKVPVSHLESRSFQTPVIDFIAMVLARLKAAASPEIHNGMVDAPVTEEKFFRPGTCSPRNKLNTKADAEKRDLTKEFTDDGNLAVEQGRITRAVTEQHACRAGCHDFFCLSFDSFVRVLKFR